MSGGLFHTSQMPEKENIRLNSWKEIADYLKRDVRTVIRWEKRKRLPVHRLPGGERRAVFAHTGELEEWLRGPLPEDLSGVDRSAQRLTERLSRIPIAARIALVLTIPLLFTIALFFTGRKLPESVTSVSFKGTTVVAWTSSNKIQWAYDFGEPLDETRNRDLADRTFIGDVDGNGGQEILVSIALLRYRDLTLLHEDPLYCFSASGRPLWNVTFKETLRFGAGKYGPPWRARHLAVHTMGNKTRIAWAINHHTWWPSVLLFLDGKGKEVGRFVHSGYLYSSHLVNAPSGPLLLVGGISNANDAAMMAVLDANQISGSSPEAPTSLYECKSCPKGRPLRYFVFPRSEYNRSQSLERNKVNVIAAKGGGIEVHTMESPGEERGLEGIYEFSLDFELQRASFNDRYWDFHRQLELDGKLTHSASQCPERAGPTLVRSWDPENGWRELRVSRPDLSAARSLHSQ